MIYAFLNAPYFKNPATNVRLLSSLSTCELSHVGIAYMNVPEEVVDPRTSHVANLDFVPDALASIVYDSTLSSDFLVDYPNLTEQEKENLFNIIELIAYKYSQLEDVSIIDVALRAYSGYVDSSVDIIGTPIYTESYASGTKKNLYVPSAFSFSFSTSLNKTYDFTIWLDDATWRTNYPHTTIVSVVPPLPADILYSSDIYGTRDNIFSTALTTSTLQQMQLSPLLSVDEYTGYISHTVRFTDNLQNFTPVQFCILYRGHQPSPVLIRQAIVNYLLSTGTGTRDGWKSRCPELFISQLFYIVPLWDEYITRSNATFQSVILNLNVIKQKILKSNSNLLPSWIDQNTEVFPILNNNIMMACAIPDPSNDSANDDLLGIHPTYSPIATTSLEFGYMDTLTQLFVKNLITAVGIASGVIPDIYSLGNNTTPFVHTTLGSSDYISFIVGEYEYYVMTQSAYMSGITA